VDPYSRGARLVGVVLRTAHLFTMAVLVGGIFLAAPEAAVRPWATWVAATGIGLLASEVSHGPRTWAYQVAAGSGRAGTALALVIGAAGSHAPKSLRKWSFRHGRVVD